MKIFIGLFIAAYFMWFFLDLVSKGTLSIRLKRLRIIDIDGKFYIQIRVFKPFDLTWYFVNYKRNDLHDAECYNHKLSIANEWFLTDKSEAKEVLKSVAFKIGAYQSKKVIFDTHKSLSDVELKKIELTNKMIKAHSNEDFEQEELLIKEIIKLGV